MKIALFVSNRTTFPQEIVAAAVKETEKALKRNGMETVVPPCAIVSEDAEALEYADFLRRNPCSGVLAVFPNFGDEGSCLTALRNAGIPILFQAYPDTLDALGPAARRDAFCGKISAVNLFRQCGVPCSVFPPHTVHPDSAAFDRNLQDFAAVCRLAEGMRGIRTGSIGARCTPFKTVRFDETALEQYGISNESFDLSEVFRRYRQLNRSGETYKANLEELKNLACWPAEGDEALKRMAGLATVICDMVKEYRLDLITLRCWTELEEELKISPCAVLSLLNGRGITANCEVDTVNAIAMRMLSLVAEEPAACLDWNNNYAEDENACILFHCGPVAPQLMQNHGKIVDHPMFARKLGCGNGLGCNEGRMKPGIFTCASGYTREGRLAFFLEKGEFGPEELPPEFFGCGGIAHFENFQKKLLALLHYGFPHHVSLCYGDRLHVLKEAVSSYLKYDLVSLES